MNFRLSCLSILLLALLAPASWAQKIDPSQLQIVEGRVSVDEFLRITGEVWNRSGEWIESPSINVEVFDAAGKPLSIQSIPTAVQKDLGRAQIDGVIADRNIVPPGEVAVFEYLRDVSKIKGRYASHKLTVSARKASVTPRMAIEGFQAKKGEDGWYSLSGRIKNVGNLPCRSAEAVIGIYDAKGKLYRVTTDAPDETFQKELAPGQSVAFAIKAIEDPGGSTIADFKTWGDCSIPN